MKERAKNSIVKRYRDHELFSDDHVIEERIKAIESLNLGVCFHRKADGWERLSHRFSRSVSVKRGHLSIKHAEQLAECLEMANKLGVIHGEVNVKNLVIDSNDDIKLIDWEIDLIQLSQGKWGLMGTHPWIHEEDQKMFKLSIKTDLLCYYCLLNKVDKMDIHKQSVYDIICSAEASKRPFFKLLKMIKQEK